MKPYPLHLEISGPTALWTRPDTGSSPALRYPLRLERGEGRVRCRSHPTFSAVKGIFESVLRWKSVNVRPTKAELYAPVQLHRYTTNYGGPLRASDAMPSPPRPGRFPSPLWGDAPRPSDGRGWLAESGEGYLGPYDAIVQAAGRCNRNGRLKPEEAQVQGTLHGAGLDVSGQLGNFDYCL